MNLTSSYSAEILGCVLGCLLFLFFSSFRKLFHPLKTEEQSMIQSQRSSNIDFIRGLSIIGIVMIHIDSFFRYYHPNDSFSNITLFLSNASRFSVPAFIISSAFFLSYKSPKEYWLSKWKNLIVPYLIIGTIAYFSKYPVESKYFLLDYLYKIISGTAMAPFYFVPLMVQFYLAYSVFMRKVRQEKTIVLVLLISLVLNLFSNLELLNSPNIYLNGLVPAFFGNFVFFFLVGFTSKKIFLNSEMFEKHILEKKNFFIALCLSLLLYLLFVGFLTMSRLPELSNHFLFYPLGMFILLYALGIVLERSTNSIFLNIHKFFSFIGKNSLPIFLIHPILIHLFFGTDPYVFWGPVLGYFIFLFLNVAIPLLIWHLVEKIKSLTSS